MFFQQFLANESFDNFAFLRTDGAGRGTSQLPIHFLRVSGTFWFRPCMTNFQLLVGVWSIQGLSKNNSLYLLSLRTLLKTVLLCRLIAILV